MFFPLIRIKVERRPKPITQRLEDIERKIDMLLERRYPKAKNDRTIDLEIFDRKYKDKGGIEKLKVFVLNGLSLDMMAAHFGVSREWIRLAKNTLLKKLAEEKLKEQQN